MGEHSRHPKALTFLFLTEMWERYGFYVVQGLLVLYMTRYFGFSDNASYTILGAFTAMAYISPIMGGFVADKFLGFKNCVLLGGLFLIAGYAILALPSAKLFLYPGLAAVIVGTGLFKPSISSLLGAQYNNNDPRLDSAFTIFYVGINSGAFLAGLSSGYIQEFFGWGMSFALASCGIVIGMGAFLYGLRHIKNPQPHFTVSHQAKLRLVLYGILCVAAISFLLKLHSLTDWLLPALGVILLVFLATLTLQQEPEARKRMLVLNTLILSSVVYWMMYLQMFFSINLFIDRLVDKDVLGLHLSTTVFYASESIFIILLGPVFAWTWSRLAHRGRNPSPVTKFILGILFAGIGMLIIATGAWFPNAENLINPLWIFTGYLMITVGELLLSPIGLSAVTMLAPSHLTGMMMGVWFVAIGFGGVFAGTIAKLSSIPDTVHLAAEKIAIYQGAFFDYAFMAFFVAILLFFIQQFVIKRFEN